MAPLNRRLVLQQIREAIRGTHADLVFLQEVIGEHAEHAQRFADWPEGSHYEFLADEMWPEYAYGQNATYPAGHHGNAILSKYPIITTEHRDISASRLEQRGLLYAQVELPRPGQILHCVNVHFGLRHGWRLQQFEQLDSFVTERVAADHPLIIAGDFNDWNCRLHQHLLTACQLHEAHHIKQGRVAKTFPRRYPLFSLDRIYFRNLVALRAVTHRDGLWNKLSDHVGLSAELSLNG